MKSKLSVLICATLSLYGCGKEPVFQGKPISHWISQLKDKDPEFRAEAARALANIGAEAKPAVLPLCEALKDKDERVRSQVAYTLACIGPEAKAARSALKQAMSDSSIRVR